MPTENDPTITIIIDGTNRFANCKRFTVKNAGILKIPTAEIVLFNKDGKYTHEQTKSACMRTKLIEFIYPNCVA